MLPTTAATTARHWAQRARQAVTRPLAPRTGQSRHVATFSFERLEDAVAKRMAAPVVTMNFDFNDDPAPPDVVAANVADPVSVGPVAATPSSARPPRSPSSPRADRTRRSAPRARRRLVDELSASWWQEQTGSSSSSSPSVPTSFFSSPAPFFSPSSSSSSSRPGPALPRLNGVLAPAPAPEIVVVRHLAPRGTRMLLAAHGAVRQGQVDKAIEALDRIPWSNLRIPIDMTRAILDDSRPTDSDAVALRLLLREIARKSTMLDYLAVANAVVRGILQVPAWDVLVKLDPVAFLLWPTMALKHASLEHHKHDLQSVADRLLPQIDYSDESLRLQWTVTALGLARVHAKSKNEAAMQRLFYGVLGPNDVPIPSPCVPLFTEFARLLVDTIAIDRPTFDSPVVVDAAATAPPPATTSDRLLPVFAVLQRHKIDADTHVNATILRALLGDRGALAGFDFLMSVLRAHPVGKTPVMAAHVAVTVDRLVRARYTSEAAQLVDAALPANHANWNAPGWHAWMLATLAAGNAQAVVDRAGPALEGVRAKHRTAYLHETVFRALEQLGRADEALAVHANMVALKHKLTVPYYMTVIRLATSPARVAADPEATAASCVQYLDEMASKRLAPNDWIVAHLSRLATDLGDAGFPLATRVTHITPVPSSDLSFEGESAKAQFASTVAPLLYESVAPGMTTNDTHARLVRARRALDAISVQFGPTALDLTAWAQYLHAVTEAFRTAAPVVRAEMVRATHVRVVDAYKRGAVVHDGYLAVLVDALVRADVPDVACALWDQVVLGGPADPVLVRDGWTVPVEKRLEPSGRLLSAMADLLGYHGRADRLRALEQFVVDMPDTAVAKREANVWTSLVEAYFRVGEPESARRVLVDQIPGLKVPVGTKLKATVAGMANRPGANAQWVVMDPEVRRVLQFKMDGRSLSL
ncbi:hypothetical protein AMAG_15861 [Allomyces macrogynus ATCC 38327]|uniref:Pentatricopeptide repeat domain-containing protein n=1 Tax=Allomyces macrogynus (strain ATCC 38327) TaxID=578462 RepID=A0A0L0T914_ALLM3|nr:hypothetical protein AMAG_15861 [Allomyces macrogynus ATCC 38327]|eukprot:KNE71205.1 hypothetical protein AMAG_15861 [Allomyces macrogynus ATCC 38327]